MLVLTAVLLAAGGASAHGSSHSTHQGLSTAQRAALAKTNSKIQACRQTAWHWQTLMGRPRMHVSYKPGSTRSVVYAGWVLGTCKTRARNLHNQVRHWMVRKTRAYQASVNQMRRAMGAGTPSRQLAGSGNIEARFNQTRRSHRQVLRQWQHPPLMADFMCIHRYEGSWTDKDSGHNHHYGGVQMGKHEWMIYGYPYTGKLWPYEATPLDQLWAAYRYWKVSGFQPWSQTAPNCGLL